MRLTHAFSGMGVLLPELPDIVTHEMQGKTASVSDKALKQVAGAIVNVRDYAQTVIGYLAGYPVLQGGEECESGF